MTKQLNQLLRDMKTHLTFVTCAELEKVRPMMPLLPAANQYTALTYPLTSSAPTVGVDNFY
jgi:hypothetical protein